MSDNRIDEKIMIAHELVGTTCCDHEQLRKQVQLLTKGYSGKDAADIVRFAAAVAEAQAEQLKSLIDPRI